MVRGDSDDISKLLREVEQSLGGKDSAGADPGSGARGLARRPQRTWRASLAVATASGVVAAVLVFVLFSALPFLGAVSGAAGAFVAAYVTVLIGRLSRRI